MDPRDDAALSVGWWSLVLRGIVALLFGIAAVFWPGLTLVTLVYLFSAMILVWGIANIVGGFMRTGRRTSWVLVLLLGFLQVGVGVYLLRHPQVSFATLILLIGFSLIVGGIFDIVGAFVEEDTATSKTMAILAGALAVLAGVVVLFQPASAGVAFVWILGIFALVSGPMMIAMGLDVKHALENSSSSRGKK
jgi:uncharacterized membrane protein HdeD (DUF308 family)